MSYGSKKTWEREDCTIDFRGEKSTAYIHQMVRGWESGNSLLIGIKKIIEITPYNFKAEGTISIGKRLAKATLEAEF